MSSSGYTLWSVTAGEQPTTAKWNLLGSNDASFNTGLGFNDQILIARHLSTGLSNKLFQQRTILATEASTATIVAYNGFPSTYTFSVVSGRTYAISLNEPQGSASGGSGAWDIWMYCTINGTNVGFFHTSFSVIGVGFGLFQTIYWQATFTGTASMVMLFNTDGATTTYSFSASATAPAQLVVNELP